MPNFSSNPLVDPERDRVIQGIPDREEEPMDEGALVALEMAEMIEQPDGSMLVMEKMEAQGPSIPFDANLADYLEEHELQAIANDLLEKIKRDKEARKKRDEQYEEGLKRSGLGKEAPGGAQFTGASRVVHPMLAEAAVDFEAAAIKELFPAEGPAKPHIFGEPDQNKLELSERQQRCLNWQLTKKVPEYVSELERVLTQVPMGGSQYMKFWDDPTCGWWTCEAVYIDDLYIPYSCADFWKATRVTHVQRLTESQVEDRIDSGMYRDIGDLGSPGFVEESKSEKASDKIEGRQRIEPNVDNERPVFECSVYRKIRLDGDKRLPYLISIDDRSGQIFSIYRNWEEDDVLQRKLNWIVDWNFIPWRGAYAIGLPHLIGGLSAAATGALRALLDSAHVNNQPGGLILKGLGVSGQTTQTQATQFAEVTGSMPLDDIRKAAMAYPYNPPSPVLFQLLGWLTDAAKGVVTTSEEKIADATNTMPVGTALALIESGAKVYSAIHKRLHRSQQRAFEIIARLCASMPNFEQIQLEELGEILASPRDFAKSLAVQPSSDPEVFSEGQRMARTQILEMQASKYPEVYNMYAVQKRILTTARIPDIDEVLPPPARPTPLNAAAENAAAATGKPFVAFPEQSHHAHIMTHILFLQDAMLGPQGASGQGLIVNMAEHLKQHVIFQYVVLVRMVASEAIGVPIDQFMKKAEENPTLGDEIDKAIAAAAPRAQQMLEEQLAPVAKILLGIFSAAEKMKSMQTPHPDAVAAATLVDREARQAIEASETLDLKREDQKKKAEQKDRELALKEQEFQVDTRLKQQRAENELQRDALMLEEARQQGNQIPGV